MNLNPEPSLACRNQASSPHKTCVCVCWCVRECAWCVCVCVHNIRNIRARAHTHTHTHYTYLIHTLYTHIQLADKIMAAYAGATEEKIPRRDEV
jgi:hypothetical protein